MIFSQVDQTLQLKLAIQQVNNLSNNYSASPHIRIHNRSDKNHTEGRKLGLGTDT